MCACVRACVRVCVRACVKKTGEGGEREIALDQTDLFSLTGVYGLYVKSKCFTAFDTAFLGLFLTVYCFWFSSCSVAYFLCS